jgi:uncharacterized protein YecE (DUF72 family)
VTETPESRLDNFLKNEYVRKDEDHDQAKQSHAEDNVRFGCISWTYPDWLGSFYPAGTKPADFLQLYARVFDLVEVDSSFYRSPGASLVKQWREKTPPNFLFSVKLPGKMSHEKRFSGVEKDLDYFEKTVSVGLGDKLACIIAQLPPNSKSELDFPKLENFLEKVASTKKFRYAFEFRNKSWFNKDTFALLRRNNCCYAWSATERFEGEDMFSEVTADFLYVRFMGKFGEFKRLSKVQKDRSDLLNKWWEKISAVSESGKPVYAVVSNHFSGFAPATVNDLRKLARLPPADWVSILSKPVA